MDRDRYFYLNGKLHANQDRQITTVLVSSAEELTDPAFRQLEPGTLAHTPGGAEVYELSPSWTWVKQKSSGGGGGGGGEAIVDGDVIYIEGMTAEERVPIDPEP